LSWIKKKEAAIPIWRASVEAGSCLWVNADRIIFALAYAETVGEWILCAGASQRATTVMDGSMDDYSPIAFSHTNPFALEWHLAHIIGNHGEIGPWQIQRTWLEQARSLQDLPEDKLWHLKSMIELDSLSGQAAAVALRIWEHKTRFHCKKETLRDLGTLPAAWHHYDFGWQQDIENPPEGRELWEGYVDRYLEGYAEAGFENDNREENS